MTGSVLSDLDDLHPEGNVSESVTEWARGTLSIAQFFYRLHSPSLLEWNGTSTPNGQTHKVICRSHITPFFSFYTFFKYFIWFIFSRIIALTVIVKKHSLDSYRTCQRIFSTFHKNLTSEKIKNKPNFVMRIPSAASIWNIFQTLWFW